VLLRVMLGWFGSCVMGCLGGMIDEWVWSILLMCLVYIVVCGIMIVMNVVIMMDMRICMR